MGTMLLASIPAMADGIDLGWPNSAFAGKGSSSSGSEGGSRRSRSSGDGSGPSYLGGGSGGGTSAGSGVASYYWQPQQVASGGQFNPNALTAAHKTLPFGTRVRVTNMSNGQSVEVTINDRGPYVGGRVIDLSRAAAGVIGMQSQGLANVQLEVLGK